MNKFIWHPTKIAEWHSLVMDAEGICGQHFEDSIEHYLVITLDQYTKNYDLASTVMAIDFLKAIDHSHLQNIKQLRTIGDQCLLLSGLFPERARRKNVSLSY